jgi:hypothetical protein
MVSKECVLEVLNRRQQAGYAVIEAQSYDPWEKGTIIDQISLSSCIDK